MIQENVFLKFQLDHASHGKLKKVCCSVNFVSLEKKNVFSVLIRLQDNSS